MLASFLPCGSHIRLTELHMILRFINQKTTYWSSRTFASSIMGFLHHLAFCQCHSLWTFNTKSENFFLIWQNSLLLKNLLYNDKIRGTAPAANKVIIPSWIIGLMHYCSLSFNLIHLTRLKSVGECIYSNALGARIMRNNADNASAILSSIAVFFFRNCWFNEVCSYERTIESFAFWPVGHVCKLDCTV